MSRVDFVTGVETAGGGGWRAWRASHLPPPLLPLLVTSLQGLAFFFPLGVRDFAGFDFAGAEAVFLADSAEFVLDFLTELAEEERALFAGDGVCPAPCINR